MDKDQGLQVIEQALQIANSKGAFKLEEAATIFTAFTTVKNLFQEPVKDKEFINTVTK